MRQLGPDHLLTLACKAARADLLFQRGDIEHARQAQEQVLAARKRALGAEHADTLRSKTALACTLMVERDLGGARHLLEKVYRAQAGRLGAEHPETRRTRTLLDGVEQQAVALHGGLLGTAGSVSELHQDAAMDDYGDALTRPHHLRAVAWTR